MKVTSLIVACFNHSANKGGPLAEWLLDTGLSTMRLWV